MKKKSLIWFFNGGSIYFSIFMRPIFFLYVYEDLFNTKIPNQFGERDKNQFCDRVKNQFFSHGHPQLKVM